MISALDFKYDCIDSNTNNPLYRLDSSCLEKDKVYLIFFEAGLENILLLRKLASLPSDVIDSLDLEEIDVKGIKIFTCSMPNEFGPTCCEMANQLDLEVRKISQAAFNKDHGVVIPASDKILVIREKGPSPIRCKITLINRNPSTPSNS